MAKRKKRRGLGDTGALRCSGGPITLRREPLDRGGYTKRGQYFGVGAKLWSFDNEDSSGHIRAATKAAARKQLLAKCPALKVR